MVKMLEEEGKKKDYTNHTAEENLKLEVAWAQKRVDNWASI